MSTRSMTNPTTRHSIIGALPQPAVLQRWLRHRQLRPAQDRAYARFAVQYPIWTASLFDKYFLTHAAAPALTRYAVTGERPSAQELTMLWAAQFTGFHYQPTRDQFAEATAVAGIFLDYLAAELQ